MDLKTRSRAKTVIVDYGTGNLNSVRRTLERMGADAFVSSVREQISSAVDLIIQANRLQGGPRKVTSITEVLGMEQDVIIMQEVFRYKQLGIDQNGRCHGQFEATGVRPTFVSKLEAAGIKLPTNLFQERVLMRD